MEFDEIRDRLVLAVLPHVAFDGWSRASLARAAEDLGLDPTLSERCFPAGAVDAVEHFTRMADRLMAEDLEKLDLAAMRVPERILAAVKVRLERWAGEREAIRRALSVLSLPQNLGTAARLTFGTVDAMWRATGDASHDFSWYTRRATLAAVYSATVLYWLDDESEGAAETRDFLRRRLGDVARIPKLKSRFGGLLDRLPRPGRPPARFSVR